MNHAYSILNIKALDEDQRFIEGIASTPTPDRVGDIVEPMGAKFSLPMPLLLHHNSQAPVGEVTFAKPNKNGIPFKAKILKSEEGDPPALKDRLDEAWQSVKRGLIRGVSIGFKSLEHAYMDEGHGIRFLEWEWIELSLVTIPANAEANISAIKSIDRDLRGASAEKPRERSQPKAGVAAKTETVKKGNTTMPKNISERISALEASRAAKATQMSRIEETASEEGRATNADENAEFDELDQEISAIDENLKRLKRLESLNVETKAKEVDTTSKQTESDSRDPRPARSVRLEPVAVPKGINFARAVICLANAKGQPDVAAMLAKEHYGHDPRIAAFLKLTPEMKAAVPAAYTGDSGGWAEDIAEAQTLASDFIEYLRPMTIVDRMSGFKRVPFNVKVSRMTTGQSGYWVGEALPTPMTSGVFDTVTLGKTKVGAIAAMSKEQMRFSNINAEMAVRDDLARAVVAKLDSTFVGTAAASAGVSPAGLLNGVSGISATGTGDADDVRTDLVNLFEPFSAANISFGGVNIVTTENLHFALGIMRSSLGIQEFPGVTGDGAVLNGRPLISSNHVAGGKVLAISAPDILLADDGDVGIEMSDQASLEMLDSSLVQDATAGTGTSLVSLFQSGLVAIKIERYINWAKGRSAAVQVVTGAVYQGAASA